MLIFNFPTSVGVVYIFADPIARTLQGRRAGHANEDGYIFRAIYGIFIYAKLDVSILSDGYLLRVRAFAGVSYYCLVPRSRVSW